MTTEVRLHRRVSSGNIVDKRVATWFTKDMTTTAIATTYPTTIDPGFGELNIICCGDELPAPNTQLPTYCVRCERLWVVAK